MNPTNIKRAIRTKLEGVSAIKEVFYEDLKKSVFDMNIAAYPAAIISPPALETSERLDNRTNIRDYIYNVMILMKPENFTDEEEVEDLMNTLIDVFDNDITLGGAADGGVSPATTGVEPVQHNTKKYLTFDVILRARHCRTLTF